MADPDTALAPPPSSTRRPETSPSPPDAPVAPWAEAEPAPSWAPDADAFPGCRAVRVTRDEIDDQESRIEYWDAATETAMVCDGVSVYHEQPSQRLAQMITLIALTRGAPIDTLGTADLRLQDEHGAPRRILEADQTVYLHPERDRPDGPYMVVGKTTLPDVVVEVDYTTDARRRKLAMYRSWRLPEVWVEVPDAPSPSRPASRKPGLTIHVLHADGYRPSPVSRAFPGWTAAEIHRAMNEPLLSVATMAVLERVGRALRDRNGAGPRDAPFLRRTRAAGRAEGRVEGRAEGRVEGRAEGRVEGRAEQRALLRRQAARRFGAETAERLADVLTGIEDPARLAEVGEWIVVCATGTELLDRCSRPDPTPPTAT